ncbi:MAG: hypothetical protein JWO62_332 [Acidimicrobiaceae bacterium]|jgi:hypothetical protein|nr:hypothetical protein [Acidimicrobiaceae bacterium]
MSDEVSVSLPTEGLGDLFLSYFPAWRQYVVALKRDDDDAPMAKDDFYVDDGADLANPTVEMLTEELRAGLSARGRSDLASYAAALAQRFAAAHPELVDA